jgi:2-oxoglutarate dehydrogenase E1 component
LHVWVHGDAALAGQGVVYELTQMAHLEKFSVGGTVHVVANNQLGFTANESMGRSSNYCTDVFKIIEAPVVHVNALSVEDVVKCGNLAVRYRNKFKNDFVIDLVGYRRYGHNEVDDPTFTNPLMYKKIREIKGSAALYAQQLLDEGVTTQDYIEKIKNQLKNHLNKELSLASLENLEKDSNGWLKVDSFQAQWTGFSPLHQKNEVKSGYDSEKLKDICKISTTVPSSFKIHPILKKNLQARNDCVISDKIDWATAEILAFGSLLQEGFHVRLCGEDSIRGTFSQRQVGVYCQETEKFDVPLARLGNFTVVNSILSEIAVVGFEYGYSLDHPKNLVLWEAQFGDFANMAQPITDTYIVSGEAKWMRQSGLALILPHGQEAQGPDHSSAQIERYLGMVNNTLSQQVNIEVYNMIHPANYFHLLRRSMLRNFRRPLIIGTPKSALRNKWATSTLEEFNENSSFRPVILRENGKGSKKLVLCNGKVAIDLLTHFNDISIVLIEQLAPLPLQEIKDVVSKTGKEFVWVQEEPKNFGVFNYIRPYLESEFGKFQVIARPELSANAVGNSKDFKAQQEKILLQVSEII